MAEEGDQYAKWRDRLGIAWELWEERLVPGVPKAQPRMKAYRTKDGRIGAYTPKKADVWKERCRAYLINDSEPHEGPCKVQLTFLIPVAPTTLKRHPGFELAPHQQKPDADNLCKAVLDALNGEWWKDDAQCQTVEVQKVATREESGCHVAIWREADGEVG